ncbi:MAG: GntR family transcriptional regulator [Lachnospiraceae bacterium]|jgi:GntR family transcriptional regulator|nr:GntR family transcriptional regulator [Lachnospiraceae bacterium]MDD3616434.1 GntR family transcriptional regulator [Lachnospiraceae bacterium]
MAWNLDSQRPIYAQIIERVQYDIVSGHYNPGDKLPSVRELACEASVNPNTMQKALSELEQSGLVYSQRTTGRFITKDTSCIRKIREELAKQQVLEMIRRMKQLGFTKEETLTLMDKIYEEATYEHTIGV